MDASFIRFELQENNDNNVKAGVSKHVHSENLVYGAISVFPNEEGVNAVSILPGTAVRFSSPPPNIDIDNAEKAYKVHAMGGLVWILSKNANNKNGSELSVVDAKSRRVLAKCAFPSVAQSLVFGTDAVVFLGPTAKTIYKARLDAQLKFERVFIDDSDDFEVVGGVMVDSILFLLDTKLEVHRLGNDKKSVSVSLESLIPKESQDADFAPVWISAFGIGFFSSTNTEFALSLFSSSSFLSRLFDQKSNNQTLFLEDQCQWIDSQTDNLAWPFMDVSYATHMHHAHLPLNITLKQPYSIDGIDYPIITDLLMIAYTTSVDVSILLHLKNGEDGKWVVAELDEQARMEVPVPPAHARSSSDSSDAGCIGLSAMLIPSPPSPSSTTATTSNENNNNGEEEKDEMKKRHLACVGMVSEDGQMYMYDLKVVERWVGAIHHSTGQEVGPIQYPLVKAMNVHVEENEEVESNGGKVSDGLRGSSSIESVGSGPSATDTTTTTTATTANAPSSAPTLTLTTAETNKAPSPKFGFPRPLPSSSSGVPSFSAATAGSTSSASALTTTSGAAEKEAEKEENRADKVAADASVPPISAPSTTTTFGSTSSAGGFTFGKPPVTSATTENKSAKTTPLGSTTSLNTSAASTLSSSGFKFANGTLDAAAMNFGTKVPNGLPPSAAGGSSSVKTQPAKEKVSVTPTLKNDKKTVLIDGPVDFLAAFNQSATDLQTDLTEMKLSIAHDINQVFNSDSSAPVLDESAMEDLIQHRMVVQQRLMDLSQTIKSKQGRVDAIYVSLRVLFDNLAQAQRYHDQKARHAPSGIGQQKWKLLPEQVAQQRVLRKGVEEVEKRLDDLEAWIANVRDQIDLPSGHGISTGAGLTGSMRVGGSGGKSALEKIYATIHMNAQTALEQNRQAETLLEDLSNIMSQLGINPTALPPTPLPTSTFGTPEQSLDGVGKLEKRKRCRKLNARVLRVLGDVEVGVRKVESGRTPLQKAVMLKSVVEEKRQEGAEKVSPTDAVSIVRAVPPKDVKPEVGSFADSAPKSAAAKTFDMPLTSERNETSFGSTLLSSDEGERKPAFGFGSLAVTKPAANIMSKSPEEKKPATFGFAVSSFGQGEIKAPSVGFGSTTDGKSKETAKEAPKPLGFGISSSSGETKTFGFPLTTAPTSVPAKTDTKPGPPAIGFTTAASSGTAFNKESETSNAFKSVAPKTNAPIFESLPKPELKKEEQKKPAEPPKAIGFNLDTNKTLFAAGGFDFAKSTDAKPAKKEDTKPAAVGFTPLTNSTSDQPVKKEDTKPTTYGFKFDDKTTSLSFGTPKPESAAVSVSTQKTQKAAESEPAAKSEAKAEVKPTASGFSAFSFGTPKPESAAVSVSTQKTQKAAESEPAAKSEAKAEVKPIESGFSAGAASKPEEKKPPFSFGAPKEERAKSPEKKFEPSPSSFAPTKKDDEKKTAAPTPPPVFSFSTSTSPKKDAASEPKPEGSPNAFGSGFAASSTSTTTTKEEAPKPLSFEGAKKDDAPKESTEKKETPASAFVSSSTTTAPGPGKKDETKTFGVGTTQPTNPRPTGFGFSTSSSFGVTETPKTADMAPESAKDDKEESMEDGEQKMSTEDLTQQTTQTFGGFGLGAPSAVSQPTTAGSLFGAPANALKSTNTFGASSFGSTTSPSGGINFKQSTFAGFGNAGSTTTSTFGSTSTNNAFGSTPSAFGQTSTGQPSAFGTPSQQTPTAFGQPSTAAAPSAFGQSSFGSSSAVKPASGFGQSGFGAQPAFGQSGFGHPAFGQTAFGQSGFGQQQQQSTSFGQGGFGSRPVFGQAAGQSTQVPPSNGGFAALANNNASPSFGALAQQSGGGIFGQPQQQQPTNQPPSNPNFTQFR